MSSVLLESRPFRPFKSSEEYLFAMKEDLAEWLQMMYPQLQINIENFMERLETGVALCEHANAVKIHAVEYVRRKEARRLMTKSTTGSLAQAQTLVEIPEVKYRATAKAGTFFARDNLSNFIQWCRESLKILECLLFESDDLIMRKNEKHVILCLLEVARRGAKFGMLAPMLVQMERQIDREIAADQRMQASMMSEAIEENNQADDEESDSEMEDEQPMMMYGPIPQIVTNDLKSLDEMVRDLVERCTCATQFPMIRVSEGKYKIGDTKVLIFVRILRNHVMVRVGGGWDTLSHYLDKHDPCRCRAQHRTMQGAKLVNRVGMDIHGAQVIYDRSSVPNIPNGLNQNGGVNTSPSKSSLGPPMNSLNRSRSRSPSTYNHFDRRSASPFMQRKSLMTIPDSNRSRSPTPNFVSTHTTKLASPVKKYTTSVRGEAHSGPQSLPTAFSAAKMRHPHASNHITHLNLPSAEATPTKGGTMKTEAVLMVTGSGDSTDHSDNASEVSDEGYRSLGIIGDKKHRTSVHSVHSQNSIEDADEIERPGNSDQEYDTNDCGLKRTQFSSLIYGDANTNHPQALQQPQPTQQQHNQTTKLRKSQSPEKEKQIKTHPQSAQNKIPPSPIKSASSSRLNLTLNSSNLINNTWNGRQRSRPSLTNETFTTPNAHHQQTNSNFMRNSPGRRSTSVPKYDNNGRRVSQSASTSPSKCIKDDLAQILHIDNDEVLMIEMNKLLKQYNFRVVDDDAANRKRKDSKPENGVTRIPAPVFNK